MFRKFRLTKPSKHPKPPKLIKMDSILNKYANLLVNYCLEIKENDWLYISSTTLAEPLVKEVYRLAVRAGAHVETDLAFAERGRIFLEEAGEQQIRTVSPFHQKAMEDFNAYLFIRAPFNLREDQNVDPAKLKARQQAMAPVHKTYFERTATRDLKRNLCQFPTQAAAQEKPACRWKSTNISSTTPAS